MRALRLFAAAALWLASACAALAQGQIPPGNAIGNASGSPAAPKATPLSPLLDQAFGSTRGSVLERGAGGWVIIISGTSGLPWVSNGPGADPTYQLLTNAGIASATILYSNIQNVASSRLLGNPTGAPAAMAEIPLAARLAFTGGTTLDLATGAITNSFLANMASSTVKGNFSGGSAAPSDASVPSCANDGVHALTNNGGNGFNCAPITGPGTVNAGGGGLVPTSGSPSTLFVEQMNPGGRITPSSGVPVPITDAAAATTIFYAPAVGKYVPIYDGTNMKMWAFTASDTDMVGQSIALGSNWAANTNYDGFEGLNSGTPTFCTGPAWSNSGMGTSARGSGAGTAELQLFKGLLTNKNSMTCRYSNTQTFTCAVNQCTYLGSFRTNGNAGQVDLKFGTAAAGGGTACLCIWNAYNQVPGTVKVSDTTATDVGPPNSWRPMLNNAGNAINVLSGLQTNGLAITASAAVATANAASSFGRAGIAMNNTTPTNPDCQDNTQVGYTQGISQVIQFSCLYAPQLGYNTFYTLERGDGNAGTTFAGNGAFYQYIAGIFLW